MSAKWKVCRMCKRLKAIELFSRCGPRHHSYCKPCVTARARVLRADKAVRDKEARS